MLGYSKIQIMGHVGATPDCRILPSGDHVVNFSVAVNRRFKDRDDNPKEVTDWYRICAFNSIGSVCANFISVGDAIFVEGRLQVRTFESRTGQQTAVEIIPSVVRFLGSANGDRERRVTPGWPGANGNGTGGVAGAADGAGSDELPF